MNCRKCKCPLDVENVEVKEIYKPVTDPQVQLTVTCPKCGHMIEAFVPENNFDDLGN